MSSNNDQIIICNDECKLCKRRHKALLQQVLIEMVYEGYYYDSESIHSKPCNRYFFHNY